MINDLMTASGFIFLFVVADAAAIASVIVALLWVLTALENVLTKLLKKGGNEL